MVCCVFSGNCICYTVCLRRRVCSVRDQCNVCAFVCHIVLVREACTRAVVVAHGYRLYSSQAHCEINMRHLVADETGGARIQCSWCDSHSTLNVQSLGGTGAA